MTSNQKRSKENCPRSLPSEGRGFCLGDPPAAGTAGNAAGQRFSTARVPPQVAEGWAGLAAASNPSAGPARPYEAGRGLLSRGVASATGWGQRRLKRPAAGAGSGTEDWRPGGRGGTRRRSPAGTGCRRPAPPPPAPPTPTPWRSRPQGRKASERAKGARALRPGSAGRPRGTRLGWVWMAAAASRQAALLRL